MRQVYLNGRLCAPEDAQVSVFDRGFVFGDGVYEVIPVYGRRPFRRHHHLARLDQSLHAIGLANPLAEGQWTALFDELIALEAATDQSLYLQVTRGPAPRDHAFPRDGHPTVFAYSQPLKTPTPEELATGGVAVTAHDFRWGRCDIKSTSLLANVLLREQAVRAGAIEAILVRDGGWVTEGAASNIFGVIGGRLVTAPNGPSILPGITRDVILEIAAECGQAVDERLMHRDELMAASEVWMTSSSKEIMPLVRIDHEVVGNARPGPVFARFHELFQAVKARFRAHPETPR